MMYKGNMFDDELMAWIEGRGGLNTLMTIIRLNSIAKKENEKHKRVWWRVVMSWLKREGVDLVLCFILSFLVFVIVLFLIFVIANLILWVFK